MKLGFAGLGNMGGAFVKGLIDYGTMDRGNIMAYTPHRRTLEERCGQLGIEAAASVRELADHSDCLMIACKPYQVEQVLQEAKDAIKNKNVVSMALGWNVAALKESILRYCVANEEELPGIMSIMPNTPVLAGEGVILVETGYTMDENSAAEIKGLFSKIGIVAELPTELMGVGGVITGCGPAFMDMIIEAYGDGAVKYGIPRATAYELVTQTMIGSARLQQLTGEHPGLLKDKVCSPGGSTIRGVAALEREGLRNACIKSVDEAVNRKA